ncbi:hypothetical protein C8Q76DRAFT_692387 [Earliella scabrosa]|nr:hypothetical protein C8Q76DRAFT_692387 [Earliella scabrosa]
MTAQACTNVHPEILSKFLMATRAVYGPIDTITPDEARTWTPPPLDDGHRGRYLWTDAFGVLNFLTLSNIATSTTKTTSREPDPDASPPEQRERQRYITLAARLIDAVHSTLGRTRAGDALLPGASDAHPLAGGLRIGKPADEDDPSGDGDGQYHHYLTVWMFALNRMARASGDRTYNDRAVELAKAIHLRFVRKSGKNGERPRMCWKMSVDLSTELVPTEGNLDPIEGYVVFSLLQRAQEEHGGPQGVLAEEIEEYRQMLERKWQQYASEDPLDLGMTLWTAHWLAGEEEWATALARRAAECLRALHVQEQYFDGPARFRLAFREFGTCLGIRSHLSLLARAGEDTEGEKERASLTALADKVIATWALSLDGTPPLVPHGLRSITLVMYATAHIPGAFVKGFFGGEP